MLFLILLFACVVWLVVYTKPDTSYPIIKEKYDLFINREDVKKIITGYKVVVPKLIENRLPEAIVILFYLTHPIFIVYTLFCTTFFRVLICVLMTCMWYPLAMTAEEQFGQ